MFEKFKDTLAEIGALGLGCFGTAILIILFVALCIGLAIGYTLSWLIEAPRLRRYSIAAKDSITIPQYLTNRFLSKSRVLQVICAVIFFHINSLSKKHYTTKITPVGVIFVLFGLFFRFL